MPRESHAFRTLSSLLVVATMVSGCARIARARQCHRLAESVNDAMAQVSGAQPRPLDAKRLREAASLYENLADELGPMEFSEKGLALEVASLNRLLLQASQTTRNLADAVAQDERAQASLLKRELGGIGAQMRLQGNKIDRACRGP